MKERGRKHSNGLWRDQGRPLGGGEEYSERKEDSEEEEEEEEEEEVD